MAWQKLGRMLPRSVIRPRGRAWVHDFDLAIDVLVWVVSALAGHTQDGFP